MFNVTYALCNVFKSLFIIFLLAIVLSVRRFTDSGYPFGIFKLFFQQYRYWVYVMVIHPSDQGVSDIIHQQVANKPVIICATEYFCEQHVQRSKFLWQVSEQLMVGYIAKNKQKYHTVRTISKSNGKIVEGESIDAPNTQIHERLLSWHGAGA